MPSTDAPRPIFLLDNPRTCSQLLQRFFASHPQLETAAAHQWSTPATVAGPERIQTRVPSTERSRALDADLQQQMRAVFGPLGRDFDSETYEVAAGRLGEAVAASGREDKNILLIKDHVACSMKAEVMGELLRTGSVANPPANPTVIPDDVFAQIKRPVFLIRHPALVVESFQRAGVQFGYEPDDLGFQFFTTPRSSRLLFDQLRSRDPVVIDGDDVVYRSEALCNKLCELWDIDPNGVRYTWEKLESNGPVHPGRKEFLGTLDKSDSVVREDQKTVDVETEYNAWKLKLGVDVADALRRRVEADMPAYEYLQQFRMKL